MRRFLCFAAFAFFAAAKLWAYPALVEVTLPDGYVITAEVAATEQAAERGLMFRTELAAHQGMLFVYDSEEPRLFWMKNTFVDLDIIFLGADKKAVKVCARVPRSYKATADAHVATAQGFGKYVLELPAKTAEKHKLAAGAVVRFNLEPAAPARREGKR